MRAPESAGARAEAALEGVRVLDVTQVMAGPFCAMQLCDMGADVIKVEPPEGDSTRRMAGRSGTDSPSFNAVNRGKRGIVLDLKSAAGQAAFRRLARRADVIIENYRPGVMRRFGLDYAALGAETPGPDLRVHLRLRPDRTIRVEGRLRPGRAGRLRVDVDHRRAGRAAGEGGRAADRPRRRAVRAVGDPRGADLPRRGPGAGSTSTRRSSKRASRCRSGRRPSTFPARACRGRWDRPTA